MIDQNNELYHHGVPGMRWGVRKSRSSSGSSRSKRKTVKTSTLKQRLFMKKVKTKTKTNTPEKPKTVNEMSDDDLRKKINRLQLEKQYRDLTVSSVPAQTRSRGKQIASEIIETAGKDVATQLTKYLLGTAVNKVGKKVFDDDAIVNPKKGQNK